MTTARCCGYGRGGTGTWAGLRTRSRAGSTPVPCELVAGGVPEDITAAQAARILGSAQPSGAAGQARRELAAEVLDDMRHMDIRIRESKKKLAQAVQASGTSLTGLFGAVSVLWHSGMAAR